MCFCRPLETVVQFLLWRCLSNCSSQQFTIHLQYLCRGSEIDFPIHRAKLSPGGWSSFPLRSRIFFPVPCQSQALVFRCFLSNNTEGLSAWVMSTVAWKPPLISISFRDLCWTFTAPTGFAWWRRVRRVPGTAKLLTLGNMVFFSVNRTTATLAGSVHHVEEKHKISERVAYIIIMRFKLNTLFH